MNVFGNLTGLHTLSSLQAYEEQLKKMKQVANRIHGTVAEPWVNLSCSKNISC